MLNKAIASGKRRKRYEEKKHKQFESIFCLNSHKIAYYTATATATAQKSVNIHLKTGTVGCRNRNRNCSCIPMQFLLLFSSFYFLLQFSKLNSIKTNTFTRFHTAKKHFERECECERRKNRLTKLFATTVHISSNQILLTV